MRFRQTSVPLLAAVLLSAAAPSAALGDGPVASVHMRGCKTGASPDERSATFVGRMRSIPGSIRMGMHFRLLETSPRSGSAPDRSPDLGPWHNSHKNVERFSYSQTVNGMTPGDSYRVVVRFRWIDASGHVIRRAKRTSAACTQPGLPNLRVDGIAIAAGETAGTAVYRVAVSNDGGSPAAQVGVALYTGSGHLIDSRTIKHLGAGQTRTVKITGPPCQTVRAVGDPENRIAESNESDNSFTRGC